ncbi:MULTISPECIES: hypothetical protein [Nocardioides]|uniref:hypothetical protein n=1 Tax=Nocardioides TaxID=1839 RepID=UPI0012EA7815|nr:MULTISPECIES: hypothetical protein [unclassified Nocardioides]MCM3515037.1 hypothetical protein [Nocardioides sp. P86]
MRIEATAGPPGGPAQECYVRQGTDYLSMVTDIMAAIPPGWDLIAITTGPDRPAGSPAAPRPLDRSKRRPPPPPRGS